MFSINFYFSMYLIIFYNPPEKIRSYPRIYTTKNSALYIFSLCWESKKGGKINSLNQ